MKVFTHPTLFKKYLYSENKVNTSSPPIKKKSIDRYSVDGFIIYRILFRNKFKDTKKVNKIGEIPNNVYSSLINLKPK